MKLKATLKPTIQESIHTRQKIIQSSNEINDDVTHTAQLHTYQIKLIIIR